MSDLPISPEGTDEFESLLTRSMQMLASQEPTELGDQLASVSPLAERRKKRRVAAISLSTAAAVTAIAVGVQAMVTGDDAKSRRVSVAAPSVDSQPSSSSTTSTDTAPAAVAPETSSTSAPAAVTSSTTSRAAAKPAPTTSTTSAIPSKISSMKIHLDAPGVSGRVSLGIPTSMESSVLGTNVYDYATQIQAANTAVGNFTTGITADRFYVGFPIDGSVDIILPPIAVRESLTSLEIEVSIDMYTTGPAFAQVVVGPKVLVTVPVNAGANDLSYDAQALGIIPPAGTTPITPATDVAGITAGTVGYVSTFGEKIVSIALAAEGAAPFMMPGGGELQVLKMQNFNRLTGEASTECRGWYFEGGSTSQAMDAANLAKSLGLGRSLTAGLFALTDLTFQHSECSIREFTVPSP